MPKTKPADTAEFKREVLADRACAHSSHKPKNGS